MDALAAPCRPATGSSARCARVLTNGPLGQFRSNCSRSRQHGSVLVLNGAISVLAIQYVLRTETSWYFTDARPG